jgi:hypothetical protein
MIFDRVFRLNLYLSIKSGRLRVGHPSEPRVLPKDLAFCLAAIVVRPGASHPRQRYGIVQAAQPSLVPHVVYLVYATMDAKDPAAIFRHLCHERQSIERSTGVERRFDLAPGSHSDDIPRPQRWAQKKPKPDPGQQTDRGGSAGEGGKHVRLPRSLPSITPQANEAADSNENEPDEKRDQQKRAYRKQASMVSRRPQPELGRQGQHRTHEGDRRCLPITHPVHDAARFSGKT